jgi:hypothetical protein
MNYKSSRRIVPVIALTLVAIAAPTFPQEKRVEINPFFGYTFSDGVTVDPIAIGGQIYNEVNPQSGMAFGIGFGVFVNENMEVGFLWGRQDSVLEGKGTETTEFADMSVNNYHAIFTYNFGEEDAKARPFVFGGLGATSYSPGEDISGETQFSSTWGGGEGLRQSQRRDQRDGPLHPDLHQERPRRLLVRLLWLLRDRRHTVLEPVRDLGRAEPPVLTAS